MGIQALKEESCSASGSHAHFIATSGAKAIHFDYIYLF
jgi:hypothetical protein